MLRVVIRDLCGGVRSDAGKPCGRGRRFQRSGGRMNNRDLPVLHCRRDGSAAYGFAVERVFSGELQRHCVRVPRGEPHANDRFGSVRFRCRTHGRKHQKAKQQAKQPFHFMRPPFVSLRLRYTTERQKNKRPKAFVETIFTRMTNLCCISGKSWKRRVNPHDRLRRLDAVHRCAYDAARIPRAFADREQSLVRDGFHAAVTQNSQR